MFNNRFNSSKNDPLIEAVKAARADGDTRRLAESMANDLFGVFSRKAVVREHLSDYDFALEEAYKCMKEEDKMADKDYDRDGKIETSKKEVWGSRLRAAKASGKYKGPVDEKKMWEGSAVSGEDPGMEVAKQAGARQQAQTPSSTPARTGNAAGSTISNARAATGMNEAQINELSRTTLKSYVKKANRQANDLERKVNTRKDKPGEEDKMYRRIDGVNLAHDKMKVRVAATNEEALDEATRKHFRQHAADISKISDQGERNKAASAAADTYARLNPRFDHAKFHAAAGSTAHQEPKKMEEAAYSAKAARAGKDIGKPGKNFEKIAKKAGEKYGSEERGKKVAGAILAKIRAKHMKEDQSFKAAQETGKSVNEVVSVAQLSAFRNKVGNQNATLGQYMNAQKGLTARKGGANDPSVIQSKLKAGQAAYNPSSSGVPATTTLKTSPASNQSTQAGQVARSAYGSTQSVATSLATSKPAQASGSDITDKATYDTKTTKPAPFQPGPSSVKLSPEPQKFSGNAEGPAPVAKPAAPAPAPEQKRKEAGSMPAAPVAESVQVGANKYRIV